MRTQRLLFLLLICLGILTACREAQSEEDPSAMRSGFEVNGHVIEPGANLSGADLSDADLSRANLRGANLTGARLTGSSLLEADLRETNLSRADLFAANFGGANLEGASLEMAVFNDQTLWPVGYNPLEAGAILSN